MSQCSVCDLRGVYISIVNQTKQRLCQWCKHRELKLLQFTARSSWANLNVQEIKSLLNYSICFPRGTTRANVIYNWRFFKTVSTVSPLQRGFKLEKVCFMKIFFKKYKYMCIILIRDAWWDFITDARFVLPKLFFSSCCKNSSVFSWPFQSEQDLFHTLPVWEPLAGLWLAIMPQTALLLVYFQTLRHVWHLPPTALTVRSLSCQTK